VDLQWPCLNTNPVIPEYNSGNLPFIQLEILKETREIVGQDVNLQWPCLNWNPVIPEYNSGTLPFSRHMYEIIHFCRWVPAVNYNRLHRLSVFYPEDRNNDASLLNYTVIFRMNSIHSTFLLHSYIYEYMQGLI